MNNLENNMAVLTESISKVDYSPKNNTQYAQLAVVGIFLGVVWASAKAMDSIQSIAKSNTSANVAS
ncbi:hypothetical protein J5A54_02255 [Prevotella melaninogenica]|uniref:hypothetical protein n=1 Tax=Prevotella melaninogenica TaxID=28132 RepID=UPI001BA5BBAE|nr:hypothetical protein [Prevotella melaninogenica]QUB63538.1 hypothetical protein J5A54_02255 [Prevotella melaninogenica]